MLMEKSVTGKKEVLKKLRKKYVSEFLLEDLVKELP
jgi:hypothetical protein